MDDTIIHMQIIAGSLGMKPLLETVETDSDVLIPVIT